MSQPLRGIRILDLSRLLPGAYASQMLADMGAEVIKVEEPGKGDYSRYMPPHGPGEMGITFTAVNRNKRSIVLNLKTMRGREIFHRLIKTTDVLLESFRPGVMQRLGLGYDDLKALKPDLIYCAISGYGQDGPYSQRAGHDLNYQGYSGLLNYNRDEEGQPVMPPTQLGDLAGGGYMAVIGILSALVGRAQTGEGRMLDISMTEGAMSLLPLVTANYLNTGHAPAPGHSPLDGALPCYNIYETKDGKHVTLAALEYKFWHTFCTHIGHLELLPFHMPVGPEERAQALEMLRAIFKTRTRDEWIAELGETDTCVGPIYSIDEALNDPHAKARGIRVKSKIGARAEAFEALQVFPRLTGSEEEQRYPAPELGADTRELLREAGYSEQEIEQLKTGGHI